MNSRWIPECPAPRRKPRAEQPAQLELTLELPLPRQHESVRPKDKREERGIAIIDFYV
jgi:hypothetical protein